MVQGSDPVLAAAQCWAQTCRWECRQVVCVQTCEHHDPGATGLTRGLTGEDAMSEAG